MAADTLFRRVTDYANRDPYPLYAELREHGVTRQDDGSYPLARCPVHRGRPARRGGRWFSSPRTFTIACRQDQRPRNWRRALRKLGDGASGLPATPVTSSAITKARIIYPDAWRRGASRCLA